MRHSKRGCTLEAFRLDHAPTGRIARSPARGNLSMRWPTGMEPEHSTVYARNEIVIPAEPERIWRWLCRAQRWPEWYSNCGWIRLRDEAGPDLALGTHFVWKTFGVRLLSQVLTYDRC